MAAGEMGGFWSLLIFVGMVLVALFLFFEVFGFTPNTGPTAAAAAK